MIAAIKIFVKEQFNVSRLSDDLDFFTDRLFNSDAILSIISADRYLRTSWAYKIT